jgi:hypothetical protein
VWDAEADGEGVNENELVNLRESDRVGVPDCVGGEMENEGDNDSLCCTVLEGLRDNVRVADAVSVNTVVRV